MCIYGYGFIKPLGHVGTHAMPEVIEETKDTAMDAAKPGAAYGLARGLGGSLAGPIGRSAGGVAASTMASGDTQKTLAALAIADGVEGVLMSGGSSNTSSRGTM